MFILIANMVLGSMVGDVEASKERVISQRENFFHTQTPCQIASGVDPISGYLMEAEVDLVVAGSEPLSIRRFYNHAANYSLCQGGWYFNPECSLVANFEWDRQEIFAAIGIHQGAIFKLYPSNESCCFTTSANHYFNLVPNGQTHPENMNLTYWKMRDPKSKNRFCWQALVVDGDGRRRLYATNMHNWLTDLVKNTKSRHKNRYTPNVWTPYQLRIQEERLPNGNIILYSYLPWNETKLYPRPHLLKEITAYNANRSKVLASLRFVYKKGKSGAIADFSVQASDGREVIYSLQERASQLLFQCKTPDRPAIDYGLQGNLIHQITRPDGRVLGVEYNVEGKVKAIYAPVGLDGAMHPIEEYTYHNLSTEKLDAEGNKTHYHFDENRRLLAIITHQGDTVWRIQRFTWDRHGNLLQKRVENGEGDMLRLMEYRYDPFHNPIEERMGDGCEWECVQRTFSQDGLNLKLSETVGKRGVICYSYIAETNLLASEIFFEGETIRKRTFHNYDHCACRIRTVIDDGQSLDPNDLTNVHYRKIIETHPKRESPCLGLPETVLEKSINALGEEILLKKLIYTYTSFGKILKEEHYDATDSYCYTIFNEYDKKERLISKTDPMGHCTTFSYDENNNVIAIDGPRGDQHQEIAYDKANRPSRYSFWQSDGTILTKEKKYNQLGQVIGEVDFCGFETCFGYDVDGNQVAIFHPDGSVEKREYDIFGNVIKKIDPNGYEIITQYHFKDKPKSIFYPDGSSEIFKYQSNGQLLEHQTKEGAKILYDYDIFGHVIAKRTFSESDLLLKERVATYTPFYQTSLRQNGGELITYAYDFSGRKLCENKQGRERFFSYDPLGRQSAIQTEEVIYLSVYNEADQIVKSKTISRSGALLQQEKYRYDEAGNCTHRTTSHGTFETIYNHFGLPLVKTDPFGHRFTFIYSYAGGLTTITKDPHGLETRSILDCRGNEVELSQKDRQGKTLSKVRKKFDGACNRIKEVKYVYKGYALLHALTERWQFGPMNRMEVHTFSNQRKSHFMFDQRGQLTCMIQPDGGRLEYEYDTLGRISRYYGEDFDQRYVYDVEDRITKIFDTISQTWTERQYDFWGNLISERLANGLEISSEYNREGRRVSLDCGDGHPIAYSYQADQLYSVERKGFTHIYRERDLQGSVTQAIFAGHLGELVIKRDCSNRPIQTRSPYYDAHYVYDALGNLTAHFYCDLFSCEKRDFEYDDLGHLMGEKDHTYLYDSLNCRRSKDGEDYCLNDLCQITNDGERDYIYDKNGNLISDGQTQLRYDGQGRLICLTKDKVSITFSYDPFHRRMSKSVFKNGRLISQENYLWDGENEIGASDCNGRLVQLRILGDAMIHKSYVPVLMELQQKTFVPIHDHKGSLTALIDAENKEVAAVYRYSAFGEEQTMGILAPWRYLGSRVDHETEYLFLNQKYYSPTLGTWITQNPIENCIK